MKAVFDSVVRTVVPLVVGFALSLWAAAGIEPDPEFATALTGALTVAFGGLYHIGVRLLETYVWPKFGWLLGLAKQPAYDAKSKHEILADFAQLDPDEQNTDLQAALARHR